MPEAVQTEFLAIDYKNRKTALEQSSWIKVAPLQNPKQMLVFDRLDEGEAAVLALAMEQDARLVIIDERRARKYVRRLQLPLTGTLGVLLLAKQEGLITSVKTQIETLLAADFYLSEAVIKRVLEIAQEA